MKKLVVVVCAFIVLSIVACSSSTHKFEIGDAAKITVTSGTTGTQVEITDTENIQYITDNINDLTYSKGDKQSWLLQECWAVNMTAIVILGIALVCSIVASITSLIYKLKIRSMVSNSSTISVIIRAEKKGK